MPDELGECVELTQLSLRVNKLRGEVPHSLGKLTKLQGLWLNSNPGLAISKARKAEITKALPSGAELNWP